MSDADEVDIEMELNSNDDATVLTLTLRSTKAIDFNALILCLESYLTDLTRAEAQQKEPGFQSH